MEIRISVGPDLIERIESVTCTCPCLDCIEGTHCGGAYVDDETGAIVGECHESADERPMAGYWPDGDNEEE